MTDGSSPSLLRDKWLWALGALVAAHLVGIGLANRDLAGNHHFLFMDEEIVFSGIYRILHADGLRDFLRSILDGGDQRYGRILWNIDAAFAAIPAAIWGDQGIIVMTRMVQALLLVTSYLLLAITLLRTNRMRLLAVALLLALPHTPYYATMPKPEPDQLLFLAVFVMFARRRDFRPGYYWVFLGLAFGSKISTLPIVLVAIGFAVIALWDTARPALDGLKATAAFFAGWALAVPSLAMGVLLFDQSYLRHYVGATLLNTGQGADDRAVSFRTWLDYVFHQWFSVPSVLVVLVAGIVLGIVAFAVSREVQNETTAPGRRAAWFLLASGCALNVLIMWKVHRVWGIYLHPGTVLIVAGTAVLLEESLRTLPRPLVVSAVGVIVIVLALQYTAAAKEYRQLANRSQTPEHAARLEEFDYLNRLLDASFQENRRPLSVRWDPGMYVPDPNPHLRIGKIWGPFTEWTSNADFIILLRERLEYAPPPSNVEYASNLEFKRGLALHTAAGDAACALNPCYRTLKLPFSSAVVFARADIALPAGLSAP